MLEMAKVIWHSVRKRERDPEIVAGERLTAEANAKTDETFHIIRELEAFLDSAKSNSDRLLETDLFPPNGGPPP